MGALNLILVNCVKPPPLVAHVVKGPASSSVETDRYRCFWWWAALLPYSHFVCHIVPLGDPSPQRCMWSR